MTAKLVRTLLTVTFAALAGPYIAVAQMPDRPPERDAGSAGEWQYSYGTPAELKGVRSLFIFTEDFAAGQRIAGELQKKLPNVVQAESPEEADVVLFFSSTRKTFSLGTTTTVTSSGSTATATDRNNTLTKTFGYGMVVKVTGPGRARVLMAFEDSREEGKISFAKPPAINFAREVAKAYEKANKR
jgi:hypothetical protein